jgi:hypothetical protein
MAELLTVSFTAARDLDKQGQAVISNVLTVRVPHVDRYVTGGAVGGDAFIGRWLAVNRPWSEHLVVIPADQSRVDPWWLEFDRAGSDARVELLYMPPGTIYADRNARLVDEGSALVDFPAYPEDDPRSARSGSWQTIRMARRAGKLSQWHCVKPPYAGRIEVCPADLAREPGVEVRRFTDAKF